MGKRLIQCKNTFFGLPREKNLEKDFFFLMRVFFHFLLRGAPRQSIQTYMDYSTSDNLIVNNVKIFPYTMRSTLLKKNIFLSLIVFEVKLKNDSLPITEDSDAFTGGKGCINFKHEASIDHGVQIHFF